ncbi:MAG: acyl-CoA desaturase [Candidatus Obscuribacterales bacterium]|nr:acyl-CoA desaturase [Candidatus Obscuribacterales bacterium]
MIWEFVGLFTVFYIWHAMGITIGYHRLLSHRSFACPKFVEYFWVFAGFLAFEGSPIWWCTMHRAHHRHVDTPLDPHSPRYGVANAHLGWLSLKEYPEHINPQIQSKDLIKDPIYRFLEQDGVLMRGHFLQMALCILFRVVIFFCFGWVPALASLLAGIAVLQIPLMLNVFCHMPKLGYKNYPSIDDSVNVWWVALLAMGEGWHNNHHAGPGSAKSGMRPWEFDPSWLMIALMQKLGLVQRVRVCTESQMMKYAINGPQFSPRKVAAESNPPAQLHRGLRSTPLTVLSSSVAEKTPVAK